MERGETAASFKVKPGDVFFNPATGKMETIERKSDGSLVRKEVPLAREAGRAARAETRGKVRRK